MFNPDVPIKTIEEEKKYGLGRYKFAQFLGEGILSYKETESLVIGICGEWGSGKTSIVNMALDYIHLSRKDNEKPFIMKFNPWNFSDHNQLIEKFFNELNILLYNESTVTEKLKSYFNRLIPPMLLVSSLTIPNQIQTLINSKRWIEEHRTESLESLKEGLNEVLTKNNRKILIIIEDIDRLNNSEIQQIFQLVKSLANFSNTIYILEFDKNIVAKALEKDVPKNYSFQYLEKIVQVILDVPKISDLELELILNTEIKGLISANSFNEQFNKNRWTFYYQNGLKYFFKDIRTIKRYINNLKFNLGLLKDEVDLTDLFAITAIQVYLPKVYDFIKHNKKIFTSKADVSEEKKYLNILNSFISENSTRIPENQLKTLLKSIFPTLNYIFDENFKEYDYYNTTYKPSRRDLLSICTPESFETYFRLSVPEWNISREEFYQIILNAKDSKSFGDKLLQLQKAGKITKFIEYLDKYVSNFEVISVPKDNISPILEALLDKGDLFVPDDSDDLKENFNYMIYRIFTGLVQQFKDKKIQCNILKNAVVKAENSVYVLFELINNLDEEVISNKQTKVLCELTQEICKKSLKYHEHGLLIENNNSFMIIWWLKYCGFETEADEILYEIFSDKEKTIKFVKNFFRKDKTQKYDYFEGEEEGIINSTIDVDLIRDSLEKIYLSPNFELLTDNEKGPIYALLHQLPNVTCFRDKKESEFMNF